jgi:hypothetical protein
MTEIHDGSLRVRLSLGRPRSRRSPQRAQDGLLWNHHLIDGSSQKKGQRALGTTVVTNRIMTGAHDGPASWLSFLWAFCRSGSCTE